MMELTNEYGFDKYFGQINENDQYHGIGRHCMVSGQIYEGSFYEGKPHGYGRVIEYHHNYTGKWEMGKKLDDSNIEWVSDQDSGALSTKFDQSLLAATKVMKSNIKKNLLSKINKKKEKNGDGSAKAAHEDGRNEDESAVA